MAMKFDIDWKQFFLQKGEKIGLGVGLGVMGLMLVFGVKGVFSGSPTANAKALNDKTAHANDLLKNHKPTAADQKQFEVDPALMTTQANLDEVKPDAFRGLTALFVPFALEDTKRRQPKIEQPVEMVAHYAEVQIRAYYLDPEQKRVMVVYDDESKQGKDSLKSAQSNLKGMRGLGGGMGGIGGMSGMMMGNMQGGGQRGMMGMGGMAGMGGMGGQRGMMAGMGGMGGMMGMQGMQGGGVGRFNKLMDANRRDLGTGLIGGDDKKKKNGYVPLEELDKQSNVRLADRVLPGRMVIWEGAFPLRKQVEDLKSALHSATLADAYHELRFAGFNVERRDIGPDGKPIGNWYDFKFENSVLAILKASGKRYAEEDQRTKLVMLPGLAVRLPELMEDKKYPSAVDQKELKELEKSIAEMEARGQSVQETVKDSRFEVSGGDIYDISDSNTGTGNQAAGVSPLKQGAGNPLATKPNQSAGGNKLGTGGAGGGKKLTGPGGKNVMPDGGATTNAVGNTLNANAEPPEYVLVRFYDATVDPGHTYQYRFQIKIQNPNHNHEKDVAYPALAAKPTVESPWIELAQHVSVPADFHYYAVDMRELDKHYRNSNQLVGKGQVAFQLQRWVDEFSSKDSRTADPVGDWAVADRVIISRGEFVGGTHDVQLPVWNWLNERFVIATDPTQRRSRTTKVPVEFTQSDSQCPVLVDSHGGTVDYVRTDDERKRHTVDKDVPREVLLLSPDGRLFVRNSVVDAEDKPREEHYQWWHNRVDDIKKGKDSKDKKDTNKPGEASPFGKNVGGKQ